MTKIQQEGAALFFSGVGYYSNVGSVVFEDLVTFEDNVAMVRLYST